MRETTSSSTSMDETLTLIPSLPNDLAALILSHIPFSHQARLKSTCKSWRIFLSSKTLFSLRAANFSPSRLSHLIAIFPEDPSITCPYLFDPEYLAWHALPRMPVNPHVYALCNFASLSVGWHLYVLGGSLFDTRSFPMDRPSPSSVAFRFDLSSFAWNQISPMLMPRGSFACTAISDSNQILVAGGGSRHTMFRAAGSRISSVERYDIEKDEWVELDGMPCFRAGCAGFVVGSGEEREFWVMGGYGESRTMLGLFPVDEYYRDAVVMKLKDGGRWKEVGDMWEDGERMRLGKIVVLDEGDDHGVPGIFMLDGNDIFRYMMASNRWLKESCVPRKAPHDSSFGFVALNSELFVMTLLQGVDASQIRRSRNRKGNTLLYLQIYHPGKKTWRSSVATPPSNCTLDFTTAVMCTITL